MPKLVAALAAVAMLAVPAAAQDLPQGFTSPEYFVVSGVAADDVLNIRAAPGAASEIVGSFAPGQGPIEVISRQGSWGEVVTGEGNGFVSMSFLSPIEVTRVGSSAIPEGLRCLGTEPFWGLDISADAMTMSSVMTETDTTYAVVDARSFAARPHSDFMIGQTDGAVATASVVREYCSDGMSNRTYPMSVRVILTGPGDAVGYEGCCLMPTW